MDKTTVPKAPLPWWAAGLILGLVQVMAVALAGPLGVSTQFVVADAKAINQISPEYASTHPLIGSDKYLKFGDGWYLDVGLIIGAFAAALITRRFKPTQHTIWWQLNQGNSVTKRFITGFLGGILILVGARFAHGCTSGQFASGWAQLSLSVAPFTVAMFACGIFTAGWSIPEPQKFKNREDTIMSPNLISLIIGALFGTALILAGLADPDKIIGTLRLKDFHALRTIAVFVLVGMLGTWILQLAGLAHLSIKPAAIAAVLIGGGLLGVGFGLTGYCPGTGLACVMAGRIDALITVLGMFARRPGLHRHLPHHRRPYRRHRQLRQSHHPRNHRHPCHRLGSRPRRLGHVGTDTNQPQEDQHQC